VDGETEKVMSLEPLRAKWHAFGWKVIEMDGHDFKEILLALSHAKKTKDAPTVIIAYTTKGKGVSFMEGKVEWHGAAPNSQQLKLSLEELEFSSPGGESE
jgi:transketolase